MDLQLFVVDDDPLILNSAKLTLCDTRWGFSGINSVKSIPQKNCFDAAFVDIHPSESLEQAEGLRVIQQLKKQSPTFEIVAISGNLHRQTIKKAIRMGISRLLAKLLNFVIILGKIEAMIEFRQSIKSNHNLLFWIGSSPASQQDRKKIASFSSESGSFLIEGESGTGKKGVVHLIYQLKFNQVIVLVLVNVAAITKNLFESDFFGHTKGFFTVEHNKIGLAETAQEGTLLLDEIEVLFSSMQANLLRFLEENGEIRQVGGWQSQIIQTQVVEATNKNLKTLVASGSFREDLFWRLSGKKIIILSHLRQRIEDIVELTRYLLNSDRARKNGLILEFIEIFCKWLGNVRELKKVFCGQLLTEASLSLIRKEDVRCLSFSTHNLTLCSPRGFK